MIDPNFVEEQVDYTEVKAANGVGVLAIGSHHDDIELGCAGMLAALVKQGANLIMVTVTLGNDLPEVRYEQREQEGMAAGGVIGATTNVFLRQPDNRLQYTGDLVARLDQYIKEFDVQLILAPSLNETHPDHEITGKLAISAARRGQNVLFYEGPSTVDFKPTLYYPLTRKLMDQKMAALFCHKSQMERQGTVNLPKWAEITAAHRAMQFRCGHYAEAFGTHRWQIRSFL